MCSCHGLRVGPGLSGILPREADRWARQGGRRGEGTDRRAKPLGRENFVFWFFLLLKKARNRNRNLSDVDGAWSGLQTRFKNVPAPTPQTSLSVRSHSKGLRSHRGLGSPQGLWWPA